MELQEFLTVIREETKRQEEHEALMSEKGRALYERMKKNRKTQDERNKLRDDMCAFLDGDECTEHDRKMIMDVAEAVFMMAD